ncbi:hypothetical protein BST97_09150 [Nonlabens spongiae]|uniref:DUF304 domain-containing protein n=1 Tax=Nonlabens spongiae TaxID=331648 RepID=A0A1W6ML06_9FLAO|nr:hypothetical protein [Nonlabens spongiae]ARN78149.1 hypothetical protein BST97_09150 [Nonlabens spongiae]
MTESRISEATAGEHESLKFIEQKRFGWPGALMLISAVSYFIAAYGMMAEENEILYSVCMVIGSIGMSISLAEQLWHTRVIKYNDKVVRVVINRFRTHYGLRYKDIKRIELKEDQLEVYKRSNDLQKIDLREIRKEDQETLMEFLEERIMTIN